MRCAQERAAFSPDGGRRGAGLRAASSSRRHRTPSLAEGHRPGPRRIAARPPRHGGPQVRIAGRRTQCRTRPFAPPAPRLRDRMRWAGGRVTPQGACGGAEGTWWRFKVAAYRSRAHAVGRSRAQAPRAARHAGGHVLDCRTRGIGPFYGSAAPPRMLDRSRVLRPTHLFRR